jgi:hypothetical protein
MYSITENIYYSRLFSVAVLLQPEPVSYHIIQGNDCVYSPSVLSSFGLPLPPTCLVLQVSEARSFCVYYIHFSSLSHAVTCSTHLIRLNLVCLMIFGDKYKLWSTSLGSERPLLLVKKDWVPWYFPPDGGVGLVPKRGCLLTLAYDAFPRWYEFGDDGGMIYWRGKTEELGEKPVPVPLCPPQIPHGLTRARTRA